MYHIYIIYCVEHSLFAILLSATIFYFQLCSFSLRFLFNLRLFQLGLLSFFKSIPTLQNSLHDLTRINMLERMGFDLPKDTQLPGTTIRVICQRDE